MSRDISISAELLMAFYIIATGEFDGVCWVNYPKLPTPFCENVKIGNEVGDLLSLRVDPNDSKLRVQLWFMDEQENSFFFTWEEVVQLKPTLAAVVFTHVYDIIENVK